jgi:hypothetical protein
MRFRIIMATGTVLLGSLLDLTGASALAAEQQDDCSCHYQTNTIRKFQPITLRTQVQEEYTEIETTTENRLVEVTKTRQVPYIVDVPYRVTAMECGCDGSSHIEYRPETRYKPVTYTVQELRPVPVQHPVRKTRTKVEEVDFPADVVEKYVRAQ